MRRKAVLCLATLLSAIMGCGWANGLHPATAIPQSGEEAGIVSNLSSCTVRETSRERLVLPDGHEIYVMPVVLAASSSGVVLLAGTPNYIWSRNERGKSRLAARDSVFGVLIGLDRRAQVIPAPVDARLVVGIRAVELPDGKWGFSFAQRERSGDPTDDSIPVTHLWYGEYDGRAWSHLELLPLPPGKVRPFVSSALVREDGMLAWAMLATLPGEVVQRAIVFERQGGRWSFRLVPGSNLAYVGLGYSDSLGLVLTAVKPDPSLPNDENSLFLYHRGQAWQMLRRMVLGTEQGSVHAPLLSLSPVGVLTWWTEVYDEAGSRREARAMIGNLEIMGGSVFALHRSIGWSIVPVTTPDRKRLWVTDQAPAAGPKRDELRFIGDSASVAAVKLGTVPNPYRGKFGAISPAPSEVLVSGPYIDTVDSVVVSMQIRARLYCPKARPDGQAITH